MKIDTIEKVDQFFKQVPAKVIGALFDNQYLFVPQDELAKYDTGFDVAYIQLGEYFISLNVENNEWMLSKEVNYPGVYRYKDGSGEPPSTDINDLESAKDFKVIVERLFELAVEDQLDIVFENMQTSHYDAKNNVDNADSF